MAYQRLATFLTRWAGFCGPLAPAEKQLSTKTALICCTVPSIPRRNRAGGPAALLCVGRGSYLGWTVGQSAELIAALGDGPLSGDNDVSVVAAAYERWGVDCFRRILGDWALAIWEPNLRSLVSGEGFLGHAPSLLLPGRDHILWSTLIDPWFSLPKNDPALNEGYIAGWLSSLPAAHETPYAGILAVPPACCVVITPPKVVVRRYWEFDGGKTIRYRSDADYEEHFREVFGKAVLRRLRADSPILAELSGGMGFIVHCLDGGSPDCIRSVAGNFSFHRVLLQRSRASLE